MAEKSPRYPVAQNPLILRAVRLIDAFAKSDDERDFFLDRVEGYILYVDLDKNEEDLEKLLEELKNNKSRYALLPKSTFYELKKMMEGFVNEKVYDIDTKDKLLDIIQSKEARENFLEFLYDHEAELEKWQQYYQERSRIRIIEWLRQENFQFVFEEDLDIPRTLIEKIKLQLFDSKVPKDIAQARAALVQKAKTYYSLEALNPRPKRGRPPKQIIKVENETKASQDIFTTTPPNARRFLYLPDITTPSSLAFAGRFDSEEEFLKSRRMNRKGASNLEALSERMESLRKLSEQLGKMNLQEGLSASAFEGADDDEDEDEIEEEPKAPPPAKKRRFF